MEPVKSRGSKDRIDKRKVPGGDGNVSRTSASIGAMIIDKRKVPGGDGTYKKKVVPYFQNKLATNKFPPGTYNTSY